MQIAKRLTVLVCLIFVNGCAQMGSSNTSVLTQYTDSSVQLIGSDRGGKILDYALRVAEFAELGTSVEFDGECESACTLYLALPSPQLCVHENAKFGFHLPYDAATTRPNSKATEYMLKRYPSWVRSWLDRSGGLTRNIKTMKFAYASQHLKTC